MDSSRFDALARSLAGRASRRSTLKGMAAALGGALGLAGAAGASAKSAKVSICHIDEYGVYHYISVSENAVPAHLAHGDTVTNLDDLDNCGVCGNSCNDGDECTIDACVEGQCVSTPNPVDCVVSEYGDWSECSAVCGGGIRTRTRSVLTDASCGGAECPALVETESCNEQACPEMCGTEICPDTAACLNEQCFTQFPNCVRQFGVVANSGGVNACICGDGSQASCDSTEDCGQGEVCILIASGAGYSGYCHAGCPA